MGIPAVGSIMALLQRTNSWLGTNVFGNTVNLNGYTYAANNVYFSSLVDMTAGNPTFGLKKMFTSAQQSITANGTLTLAHGLGAVPVLIQSYLICTTADNGYAVGDIIQMCGAGQIYSNTSYVTGAWIVPDATNLNVRFGSAAGYVYAAPNKSTGAIVNLTLANWNVVFRAWA